MYSLKDIDDYLNRLTEEQKEEVVNHANKYDIKPEICAWYNDEEDFLSDWCHVGYSKEEALDKLLTEKKEFLQFNDNQIVRFVY